MRYTRNLEHSVPLLFRSAAVFIVGMTFVLITYLHAEAASIVVGGSCGLADAISSANQDNSIGTCTPGSGADTVVLTNTTYVLTTTNNSFIGTNTGLPPITSTVTISGNGGIIQRDLSLSCPAAQFAQTFRLFAVDITGDLTLDNVTLQNGCEIYGGGVLAVGNFIGSSNLTVRQSTLLSNTVYIFNDGVGGWGGGLYFHQGIVEDSIFRGNYAEEEGGAIYMGGLDDKYLLSNQFLENTAGTDQVDGNGAALYLASAVARIDNNVFAANRSGTPANPGEAPADIALGAIVNPSTLYGNHNTMVAAPFDGSTAVATGLDVDNDSVFLTDTIISGYDFGLVAQNSTIVANGVLWDGTGTPTLAFGTGVVTVTNDLTGTAAFVAPAAHNYHLTLASAAINTGVSNEPPTDFDDEPRPVGVASDIGFDEFTPTATINVNKSASTDANNCNGSDLLTVPENTAVYYCVTLQNTGNLTLTHHTVTDALLGVQSTFTFTLAPLASVQITRSQISALGPITITESVTNTVLVTSTNVVPPIDEEVQVAQFPAIATDTGTAVVIADSPTALPPQQQPPVGDNQLYLPALH